MASNETSQGGPPPNGDAGGAEAAMGAIRDLGQQIEALGQKIPVLQAEVQQMRQILRKMVMKAGQSAPTQNQSASALPMGG